ncbi:EamA family transporter [Streptomyces sp. NPDC006393]|uniref:EamA family transporter n=1 Tax=Streptomyces sp. NPDC006393 TaxID=3156763 RepID=UPI0033C4A849
MLGAVRRPGPRGHRLWRLAACSRPSGSPAARLPFACRPRLWEADWRPAALPTAVAGLLSGVANLLFLTAAGHGRLTVVAVITALCPAATALLARVLLAERSTRLQAAGLLPATAATALTSPG